MTPENRKKLLDAIGEYGAGLARMEGEREHLKAIALNASTLLGIDAKGFITVATAYHKDQIKRTRTAMEQTADLFDLAEPPP
jgi:hypothetical protein